MMKNLLSIFLLILFPVLLSAQDEYDVYLLIGQSNAVGFAPLEPGDEKVVEGVFLLDSLGKPVPCSGIANRFSSLPKLGNRMGYNLGVSFGRMMHEVTGRKILLVVNAKGATAISQWLPTAEDPLFYNEAVRRTKQAQAYGPVKGILWHQGCGDAKWTGQYAKRAKILFGTLRKDLGDEDIPVVVGEIGKWLVSKDGTVTADNINEVLRNLPYSIPNLLCASSEGCTPIYDKIHFDHKSLELLGQRYASKMLSFGQGVLIEAESFAEKGGWQVDQQFMDQMGSPYLLAHGLGKKVNNAKSEVFIAKQGWYHVYARTYNWTSPWTDKEGPGKFRIKLNQQILSNNLGCTGNSWNWDYAGKVYLRSGDNTISLVDQTGFDGRCDAIWITSNEGAVPPQDGDELLKFRKDLGAISCDSGKDASYDFVVVGGGVAGICAAVSAARKGLKVALVNDRPVLGGNNSSEIRVHLGGHIEIGKYPALGRMLREFGHDRFGNAMPAENYRDEWKQAIVDAEKNITLYPSCRAVDVKKDGNRIKSITIRTIESGIEFKLNSPLFADCTGDAGIGYLAGADFRMGREAKSEFNESLAPEKADAMTMGASVQWYAEDKGSPVEFPVFEYGIKFNEKTCERALRGDWMWETGMNLDQISQAERIRDYGMLVVYSNWSYQKNELKDRDIYKNQDLAWVAYVAGKRESRRLLGDYILTQNDIDENIITPDGTATTSWSLDIHWPEIENSKNFPGNEYKSETEHIQIYPHAVPYRCLYSRNISNLFMAGRDISVTHVALGNVRVMRTTAMLGEVVGLAASVCHAHSSDPGSVYPQYWDEMDALLRKGAALDKELPDNQKFNRQNPLSAPRKSAYTIETNMYEKK